MTVQVQHELKAVEVKRGDLLHGREITGKDIKTKYVYLTHRLPNATEDAPTPLKFERNQLVTVTREEKTDEEREAEALEWAARRIRDMKAAALKGADPVKGRTYEIQSTHWLHSEFEKIVQAEFTMRFWAQVDDLAERMMEQAADDPEAMKTWTPQSNLVEATRKMAKRELVTKLLEGGFRASSTNQMSNVIEHLNREAATDLLRDLRFAGLDF